MNWNFFNRYQMEKIYIDSYNQAFSFFLIESSIL